MKCVLVMWFGVSIVHCSTLQQHQLHKFELAVLANLCPTNGEEAKTLLPSLEGRFDETTLGEILDDVRTHISYQY